MVDLPTRRLVLGLPFATMFAPGVRVTQASAAEPLTASERYLGNPDAKLVVQEWFSLTCTHCAAFARETFPEVKSKLIDTGRVLYIFRDIPSDRVGLMAAVVSRALPPERYEPFIMALFASQQRWAFDSNTNPQSQLQKMAVLAGMSPQRFNQVISDEKAQQEVLSEIKLGEDKYNVEGTPTFVFGKTVDPRGAIDYREFEKQVVANGG